MGAHSAPCQKNQQLPDPTKNQSIPVALSEDVLCAEEKADT